jgi:hypothetical protein
MGLDKVFVVGGENRRARSFGPCEESILPLGFAPAYGNAVVASRRRFRRGAEAPLYLRSKGKSKSKSKGKGKR